MRQCCEICRYGERYPVPKGKRPIKPKYPKIEDHGSMYALGCINSYLMSMRLWSAWAQPWRRFEKSVQCRRFPEFQERSKSHWCGEFEEDALGPVEVATP